MRLPRFEYSEPKTIEEACSLLSQKEARVIAGGTDLLVSMKQKVVTPKVLVNIKTIPDLNYIDHKESEELRIGAATTLRTIGTSLIVRERFSALAQAASSIGAAQISNMATLGGNVCLDSRCFYYNQSHIWRQSHSVCYKSGGNTCHVAKGSGSCLALFVADTAPALIALGAEVVIASPDGKKQIALGKFYTGTGEKVNLLQPGQILTQIRVPSLPPHTSGVYLKYSLREPSGFAVVGAAVVITLKPGDGVCANARIVLGSVATSPIRVAKAEGVIKGREIDDGLVENVAQVVLKEIHPITHMGIPASYKRRVIEALTKRALRQAWHQAKSA